MTTQTDRYQQHIHVFRGIAIMLIVCAHTLPSLNWTENPLLYQIINSIANESSMFFFFIAGYLFQHLSEGFAFKRYLRQKFKTVTIPYLILSIPALIVFTGLTQRIGMWPWFYDLPIWGQVALFLLTGKHLAPLWFVPTITLFYFAAPLFLYIDKRHPNGYWIILPLLVLSAYIGRGGKLGPLNFAIYLLPLYMLGMAFSHYKEKALLLIETWWPLLTLVALVSLLGLIYEWPSPPHFQVLMKTCLVLLFTWLLSRHHQIFGTRLNFIADVSFGIFFIHAYFILAIKLLAVYVITGHVYGGEGGDVIPGNPLTFIVYATLVLSVSVSVIWVAKRIFGKNSRMLIGA